MEVLLGPLVYLCLKYWATISRYTLPEIVKLADPELDPNPDNWTSAQLQEEARKIYEKGHETRKNQILDNHRHTLGS